MPNDEVVQELNIKQAGCGKKFTREPEVLVGWLRVAARMIVDSGEANAMRLKDRSQQLADAHTRTRSGPRIDMTQVKQPIAPVDDGDVQLLLCRATEDRLSDGGEVGRCLHAGSLCGPPGGEITCRGQGASDEVSGVAWHAGAQQPLDRTPL
jgi:hypothetical protein